MITKDDVEQTAQADALLRQDGPFWISRTVLLELGWTLKSAFDYDRAQVNQALGLVATLDKAEVESPEDVGRALRLHTDGLDLGDAFIRAFAPDGSRVATFVDAFVKRASNSGEPGPPVELVEKVIQVPESGG